MNLLREYIREALLTEYWPARTEGKKNVWRGMKIKMSPAILASKVRQYIKTGEEKGITQQELIRFLLGRLEGESTGASWSLSFDVAVSLFPLRLFSFSTLTTAVWVLFEISLHIFLGTLFGAPN